LKEETKIRERGKKLTVGSRKEGYPGLKDKCIDECMVERKIRK